MSFSDVDDRFADSERLGGCTFGSMALADCGEIPESVTLFCDGHEVAVLPCRLWGSIPLDPGRFIDPAEILRGSAPPAPYQEVCVDPAQGTATEIRARDFLWSTRVHEESQRDLRDFSHVRIIERVVLAGCI
jgi:hypothetical protein